MEGQEGRAQVSELRVLHLPTVWTVLLDIAAWFVIHMGVVAAMVSLPVDRFSPAQWPFRERSWELGGRIYEWMGVRWWKDVLPDGADILRWRSFRKSHLAASTSEYLDRFSRETCRAEATHVLTMVWAPLFFFWNPVWVGWLMIVYASCENLPLIVAQRYNRIRLERLLRRAGRRAS